jgi:SAM-dependent methyltransferase
LLFSAAMDGAAALEARGGAADRAAAWSPEGQIAYEALAPAYDDFTAHHDYELWLGNLLPIARSHGLSGRRLLDVGCGTGKSFLPMLRRGWRAVACDISPAMVERARVKVGDAVELHVADMRELPVFGEFDLVWALDDALNYMLSGEEMRRALSGMRENLAPGGLLMFDVNCLQAYRTFFAEEQRVRRGGRLMVWRGQGSPDAAPGTISEARLEAEVEVDGGVGNGGLGGGDAEPVEAHVHRQRHFPEEEMREHLEATGLECVDVVGHGYDAVPERPVRELAHSKAVYFARRA